MAKIEISKAAEILKKNQIDPAILRRVVEELNLAAQPNEDGPEKEPAVKKQFVVLISDPEGLLPNTEFAGWVLQMPEDESPATIKDRIFQATYAYNSGTNKGRLFPAKSVGESLENLPPKAFKNFGVWVKTRAPVLLIKTDNQIPKE